MGCEFTARLGHADGRRRNLITLLISGKTLVSSYTAAPRIRARMNWVAEIARPQLGRSLAWASMGHTPQADTSPRCLPCAITRIRVSLPALIS